MAAAVQARPRRHVARPMPRDAKLRLLPASMEPRPPDRVLSEEQAVEGPAPVCALPHDAITVGLASLRSVAEDAERIEREHALRKLPGASSDDAFILEQLGGRLVDGLVAYLAARIANFAADSDSGAIVARLFAPPT